MFACSAASGLDARWGKAMPEDPDSTYSWRKGIALISAIRPLNLIIVGAGVWLGAHLSGSAGAHPMLPWAVLSAVALAGAGNAHNDWMDADKDRVNRPDRALPSELIAPSTLLLVSGMVAAVGLASLLPLSGAHAVLFGLNSTALLLYNGWASRRPLIGNLLVAALVGSTILFGALATGINDRVVVAAAFAAAATLARELVKDVQDVEGDGKAGARTLAVVAGKTVANRCVNLVLLLLVPATLIPFILLDFGGTYLLGMSVTCALLVASAPGAQRSASQSSSLLKWAMVTGTLALLFTESPII